MSREGSGRKNFRNYTDKSRRELGQGSVFLHNDMCYRLLLVWAHRGSKGKLSGLKVNGLSHRKAIIIEALAHTLYFPLNFVVIFYYIFSYINLA
jgi:hypothetical protein